MLTKRTLAGLAPLLAVIAFAVVPAMAQASPEWLVAGNAIPAGGKVTIKSHGGPFVLQTTGGGEIKCSTLTDTGELFAGSPGTGEATLTFTGCTSNVCPPPVVIHPGVILLDLMTLTEILILLMTLPEVLCNGVSAGFVEESTAEAGVVGSVSGKKLVFSKAGNLSFGGEEATITGEDEQEGTKGESITVS